MDTFVEQAKNVVRYHFAQAQTELENLVRIPSVSWPAFDSAHVMNSAHAVADLARGTGVFDTVEILRANDTQGELGQPAVIAKKNAGEGMPTILLYAHHDVQPSGDLELWHSQPFEPFLREDRLFGRGSADDKAGVILHLSAVQLLHKLIPHNDLGIVLFIEGEEEYGSPSFQNFLTTYKEKLSSDVIVVADSGNWDINTPAITTSLRGNVTFNLTVATLDHALHSGMFGGVAPDAVMALSVLVSSFYDEHGNVKISGLVSAQEEVPHYDEQRFRAEAGMLSSTELVGTGSIPARLWLKPSVTVTGIDVTNVENASNTLIPKVKARISVRVSPNQSAQEAYEAVAQHIREHIPFGSDFSIKDLNIGEGYHVEQSGEAFEAYRASVHKSWGVEPVNMGVGGSIPFISDFVSSFPQAQVLVTGVEDPDSRAHSPNESLHLPSFEKGILAELLFLVHYVNRAKTEE